MSEQTRGTGLWQIGTTALLTAAAVGGVQFWVQGDQHVTGNISGSGSLAITEDIKVANSPFCVYVGGKAVDCYYAFTTMVSTGGVANAHLFKLHHTGSAIGFTGSASMLDFSIYAEEPGESITFNCGFSTGSLLTHPGGGSGTGNALGTARQLINAGAVSTGNQLFVDGYSKNLEDSSTGGLLWRGNTWFKCTTTTTIERTASPDATALLHYREY